MSAPRKIKEIKVDEFKDLVSDSKAIVLAEYKGLTVLEMETLRKKLREAGGQLVVIKNTLAKVALNSLDINVLDDDLNGQVAFVFSQKDAVMGTRVAFDFTRRAGSFVLISGLFNGQRMSQDEIKALASMPSRDQLQARFVGILVAPLVELVTTLQAPHREFIGTLEAWAAKNEKVDDSQAA